METYNVIITSFIQANLLHLVLFFPIFKLPYSFIYLHKSRNWRAIKLWCTRPFLVFKFRIDLYLQLEEI